VCQQQEAAAAVVSDPRDLEGLEDKTKAKEHKTFLPSSL
jgi:hypothetical protein